MIFAMISGALFRDPEAKAGKNGGAFVAATLKHLDGGRSQFVRLTAFDPEARAELAGLGKGDALAIVGRLSTEIFKPENGEPRVSLSIIADRILPLRKQDTQRKSR